MGSTELHTLIDCLKLAAGFPPVDGAELDLRLAQTIPGSEFWRLARYHQVTSLIYRPLHSLLAHPLPDPVGSQIQTENSQQKKKRLWLATELVRIHKGLQGQEIRTLCLKGPLLSLQLYGDLLSRHQGDLDLLIEPASYPQTKEILMALGYTYAQPQATQWTPAQEQTYLDLHGQISFYRTDPGCVVDIHTRWFRNPHAFPLAFSTAWLHRHPHRLQGCELSGLDPAHTLYFLCMHGAKHRWEKLFWLFDIVKWLQVYPDQDWQQRLQEARQLGCERALGQAFLLLQSLMTLPIPQVIEDYAYQDPTVLWLAGPIRDQLEAADRTTPAPIIAGDRSAQRTSTSLGKLWQELQYTTRLQNGLSYKLACFFHLRTSTRDWDLLHLPPGLSCLYYPLRPILYLMRRVRSWRQTFKDQEAEER